MRWLLVSVTVVMGVVVNAAGCKAFETNLQDTSVDYLETAQQNFDSGEERMKAEQYNEAIKFFDYVKNKYPYSKYAVLAELRTADAHFAREKWLEAADAYRIFVRFHPRHEQVPYATYRVALAHSNQIDRGVWWFPLSSEIERDQTAAQDAVRAFDEYLQRFPNDPHVAEAKVKRAEARERLAQSDMYAAQFYEERNRFQGAIWRYERVANDFRDTPSAAEALLRAGVLARDELDDKVQARAFFARLVKEHPDSDAAKRVVGSDDDVAKDPTTTAPATTAAATTTSPAPQ